MSNNASIAFKSFDQSFRYSDSVSERIFCSKCCKPIQMPDDDLEDIYSRSDFCVCVWEE